MIKAVKEIDDGKTAALVVTYKCVYVENVCVRNNVSLYLMENIITQKPPNACCCCWLQNTTNPYSHSSSPGLCVYSYSMWICLCLHLFCLRIRRDISSVLYLSQFELFPSEHIALPFFVLLCMRDVLEITRFVHNNAPLLWSYCRMHTKMLYA